MLLRCGVLFKSVSIGQFRTSASQVKVGSITNLSTPLRISNFIHDVNPALSHSSISSPTLVQQRSYFPSVNTLADEKKTPKVPKENSSSRFSELYQKKSPIEHVLLRPDTYIGSTVSTERELWILENSSSTSSSSTSTSTSSNPSLVFDDLQQKKSMVHRRVRYVPGLFKIFDEILVNAADNKQRDPRMSEIKVNIDVASGTISVYNDGKGVPIIEHATEKIPIPSMVFGQLLTGSNFDDSVAKVTGGRNGYGAKLTNIFSNTFTVETNDTERGLHFQQTWSQNMSKHTPPVVSQALSGQKNFTRITFSPDLQRFGLTSLMGDDILHIMLRRTFDLAACNPGVRISFNDLPLPCSSFEDYANLFPCIPGSMVYSSSDRWEVGIGLSDTGQFEQVSFVNSVNTVRGGTHISDIIDPLTRSIADKISRKNTSGVPILPAHIRNHLFIFVRCLVENPSFDSQTKETLITRPASFGSRFKLSEAFVQQLLATSQLQERVLSWALFRKTQELNSGPGKNAERASTIYGIPKLDDANLAGGPRSLECTLILTEGDSAKALAVSGLSILGRDVFGIFPLKGKLLNVREASHDQLLKNAEFNHLKRIIGLDHALTYEQEEDLKSLRYGKIMLMTDQDNDGSHIKGLLINLFHTFWPALLKRPDFLSQFITPIVKAKSGKQEKWFYNMPEYEQWKRELRSAGRLSAWTIKYYKGLGTSTSLEGKDYFSHLDRHRKAFQWNEGDEASIELAFAKSKADARKDWINQFYSADVYLDSLSASCSYREFVNRELILFSHADNVRSIPNAIDGLKPGQRKALYACFKRNLKAEIKVAQLAGYISEHTGYHHGETSLHSTIINMAQNFVGSNNLPLLFAGGQFGTRLQGGKDAASARYIFTKLNPWTRTLFPEEDDMILDFLEDDGDQIEPSYYVPIIPMLLVNGSEGIGTGWSASIPAFHPVHIIDNILGFLDGKKLEPMHPWYAGFTGTVERVDDQRYLSKGSVQSAPQSIRITELPIGKWTSDYKEFLEDLCSSKKSDRVISSFREHHSEQTVDFQIIFTPLGKKFVSTHLAKPDDLDAYFKLSKPISLTNMHAYSASGRLKHYNDPREILEEFIQVRLKTYEKRRAAQLAKLKQDHTKIQNRCRFTQAVVDQSLVIFKRSKQSVVDQLKAMNFDPRPTDTDAEGFTYLLNTSIFELTQERIEKLDQEATKLSQQISSLEAMTDVKLYKQELRELRASLMKLPQFKKSIVSSENQ